MLPFRRVVCQESATSPGCQAPSLVHAGNCALNEQCASQKTSLATTQKPPLRGNSFSNPMHHLKLFVSEVDLPNLGLDSMCSWTCCSQDLSFNGPATAVNHHEMCKNVPKDLSELVSQDEVFKWPESRQSVPSIPSCCANRGKWLYSCNRSVTPLSQGGIGSWKSLAHLLPTRQNCVNPR